MMAIDWDQPTHLFGLPYTKTKPRQGVELFDTLAACVARWLSLPGHHRQNCTLSFYEDGKRMLLEDKAISRFIERVGLPPAMAAQRGGQPGREELTRIAAVARYEPPRSRYPPAPLHSTPPRRDG